LERRTPDHRAIRARDGEICSIAGQRDSSAFSRGGPVPYSTWGHRARLEPSHFGISFSGGIVGVERNAPSVVRDTRAQPSTSEAGHELVASVLGAAPIGPIGPPLAPDANADHPAPSSPPSSDVRLTRNFEAIGHRLGKITIRTRSTPEHVEIQIADDGLGIPETIRDRIMAPYFTTKPVGKGTGQGLPLARRIIVDQHRGGLYFESQVGVGTTFFIGLPGVGDAK
jgi:hypothetical protein